MLGLKKGTIELIPYTQEWKRLYREEETRLKKTIGGYIEDIQHVGSTAIDIPGMVAKPILDISVRVDSLALIEKCVPLLVDRGYEYRGEYGIRGRHYFVKGKPRTHHLHMMLPSCPNWLNQLHFRDYLLSHPEKALEYAQIKKRIAAKSSEDRAAYTEAKDPFISSTLKLARQYYTVGSEHEGS